MAYYKVSADMSEEEKAVGGIMTLKQAGWIALGLIFSAAIFVAIASAGHPILGAIFGLPPGIAFGCFFAFKKIEGLSLFTYLCYQHSFRKKTKYLVNTLSFGKKFGKNDELSIVP